MAVDTEDGYVKAVRATPANALEVNNLGPLLERIPEQAQDAVFADKDYHSQANHDSLKARGI